MPDNIGFHKIRMDQDFAELKVTAENSVISASAKIYVTQQMLDELKEQIETFLCEPDLEGYWENDVPAIGGPPCVTMKFLPQPAKDQVLVEIYMELNDGGSFMDHNCRFFVATSRTHLHTFSQALPEFLSGSSGIPLVLNR